MNIHITNVSLPPMYFNTVCFYMQLAHDCKRVEDGVLFENIPINPETHYKEMGRIASTEEYYRYMIKRTAERALIFDNRTIDSAAINLEITYTTQEESA